MTGMRKTLKATLSEARAQVEAALKEEGFGILTEINMAAPLKASPRPDKPPDPSLAACNPSLAAKALEAEPEIGLLLPCNVVLREAEEGVEVLIQDPKEMFRVLPEATQRALAPVAEEARTRLSRALARL